jgi:hypothetical protein
MSKLKLTLNISLVLMLLSSLIVLSLKANAGQAVIQGTSPDSSGINGDSFAPENAEKNLQTAPNTGISVNGDGVVTTPPVIQENLNKTARNILINSDQTQPIYLIIVRGKKAESTATEVKTAFVDLGASPEQVQQLVNSLLVLLSPQISSAPSFPTTQANYHQVAKIKLLKTNNLTSQAETTQNVNVDAANVDINQLNNAINAYNQIVQNSNLETLKKLAKDPNFQEAGRILKELRAAL